MDAFSRLNRSLREYIYQSGWQELRPIQKKAITFAQESPNNFVIAAPTASGKTEAAFLPAMNSIEDWDTGVRIVYISPLIALINDQFKRLMSLCSEMGITVTSWHGEANSSKKKKLLKKPNGIVLITPESIEAMLVGRPHEARTLFAETDWIIIDEIHSFLGENRGIQLQSLLNRLATYTQREPRCIGLSATLNQDDYINLKSFFQNQRETSIIVDRGANEKEHQVFYFPKAKGDMHSFKQEMDVIYQASLKESMLVFPNSRNKVEKIGSNLNQRAETDMQNFSSYFVHHASLPKQTRLFAEEFAKESRGRKFTITCTSTLELGIDIGSVDSVVQYGAPPNVSTLSQRIGRSGRRTGVNKLRFIANEPWSLLQGLATIELLEEGQLDNTPAVNKPYDVLAHQIISLVIEHNGLTRPNLLTELRRGKVWEKITEEEINELIDSMLSKEYLELLDNFELISGYEAQPLLRMAEFYTQFFTEPELRVYHQLQHIGTIALEPGLRPGDNILLSGKVWRILGIEFEQKQVHVMPAKVGEAYFESRDRQDVSNIVRQRMREILYRDDQSRYSGEIRSTLNHLADKIVYRDGFYYQLTDQGDPWLVTFLGSKANRTLAYMIELFTGQRVRINDLHATTLMGKDLDRTMQEIRDTLVTYQQFYDFFDREDSLLLGETNHLKYQQLVPRSLMIDYVIENQLDLMTVFAYLSEIE
ncbi:DEAD/DEAH box helicase [Ruoffia sp. FAM 26254]|jgi:ATP-dependent Lhr-like helicase|uniref:DEAD/DEAH box helicase n=1 Tax=Ruoffia sp. FAM 26254 TaxID=3259518 RepID=UPI003883D5B7